MTAPPFHTYREYRGFAQSSESTRADHTRSPGFSGGAYVCAREVRIESWREFFQSRVDVNPRLAMAAVIDDDVACATDCCFAYCNRQWEYCTLLLGFIDLQGTSFHSTGGSAQLFRARRRGAATV